MRREWEGGRERYGEGSTRDVRSCPDGGLYDRMEYGPIFFERVGSDGSPALRLSGQVVGSGALLLLLVAWLPFNRDPRPLTFTLRLSPHPGSSVYRSLTTTRPIPNQAFPRVFRLTRGHSNLMGPLCARVLNIPTTSQQTAIRA
jgi:hypothetical protein